MLSSKAKYGLKAMVYLARHEDEGAVVIQDIAEAECIPKKFLDTYSLADMARPLPKREAVLNYYI